jgi:uncharacterized protein YcbK (DUF882 family)
VHGLRTLVEVLAATLSTALVAVPLEAEPGVGFSSHRATRKGDAIASTAAPAPAPSSPAVLATLVQIHTGEHVVLGPDDPPGGRFDELLSDRTTGERHALDPRLLALLRSVAARVPGARIELVSGFRSPKLNERLRKKGHHVASHSQHSLGHAVDFRVIPEGSTEPMEPAAIEALVRHLEPHAWDGGVGIYPGKDDRFVHCDVGPHRRWLGR